MWGGPFVWLSHPHTTYLFFFCFLGCMACAGSQLGVASELHCRPIALSATHTSAHGYTSLTH